MSYNPQAMAAPAVQPPGTFPCPRCGSPVRHGVASCPNCNAPLYGPAPGPAYQQGQAPYGAPYPGQVAYGTTYPGYPTAAYARPGAQFAGANHARRAKASQEVAAGGVLLALGLLITFGSMAVGGRSYFLFYGPIIFGLIYLVKGLAGLASIPK
jgi:hypothetical protein